MHISIPEGRQEVARGSWTLRRYLKSTSATCSHVQHYKLALLLSSMEFGLTSPLQVARLELISAVAQWECGLLEVKSPSLPLLTSSIASFPFQTPIHM